MQSNPLLTIKGVEEAHHKFDKISFKNIFDHAIIEPEKYSDSLISETKELGGDVTVSPTAISGYWTGIYRDAHTGQLYGTEV